MANKCMLCGKKIGLFSVAGEDIFTGNSANAICKECIAATDIIFKKAEMKIPVKPEDLERFTDEGRQYVTEYISADGVLEGVDTPKDPMQCEIGEAIISHTFEVDDNEVDRILDKLHNMNAKDIEKYLDPLVSENESADAFFNEIMALSDEELESVLADQREYYNNAEWAYILFLKERRDALNHTEVEVSEETAEVILEAPDEVDSQKLEEFKEQFSDRTKEELQEILEDGDYLYEARKAAEELLKDI